MGLYLKHQNRKKKKRAIFFRHKTCLKFYIESVESEKKIFGEKQGSAVLKIASGEPIDNCPQHTVPPLFENQELRGPYFHHKALK